MNKSSRMAAAIGLVAIAACSGRVESFPENPVGFYGGWSEGDIAMEALLTGNLEIRDGCLVVVGEPHSEGDFQIPVFPHQYASWDANTGLLTYDGIEYGIGDSVWTGGGGVPIDAVRDLPPACVALGQSYVFLVQDSSLEPLGERDVPDLAPSPREA